MKPFVEKKTCRICGNKNLKTYLDLGKIALVNRFFNRPTKQKKYPLKVNFCPACTLSQLSIVVKPTLMFDNYSYHTSVSTPMKKHFYDLAKNTLRLFNKPLKNIRVIDIASNDGLLLSQFKKWGVHVLGVDPAKNLANEATIRGIPTIPRYWNYETAKFIREHYGNADIITATNVLAHVDDLNSFMKGVRTILHRDGIFIVEVPHVLQYLKHTEFDTTYHEHLSYFSLRAIQHLFHKHGLHIIRVETPRIHGGSLRVFASLLNQLRVSNESDLEVLSHERFEGLNRMDTYTTFNKTVKEIIKGLRTRLKKLRKDGKKVIFFGASAKGTVLLNMIGREAKKIKYVVDETPAKKRKYIPNLNLQVVSMNFLNYYKPDYIFITPWNFKDEIIKKTKHLNCKYIIPING